VPAQGAREPHRPTGRHTRPNQGRRRRRMARVHAQGGRPGDLRGRTLARGRRGAAQPAAVPPGPQPPETVRAPRQNDPPTPRRDPRRDPPRHQPRPHRGAQQQGPTDYPPRIRLSLRPSRARARAPHLRTDHPPPPTRTTRARNHVTLTTSMPREPEIGGRCPDSMATGLPRRIAHVWAAWTTRPIDSRPRPPLRA
jgi:hypothetical protein